MGDASLILALLFFGIFFLHIPRNVVFAMVLIVLLVPRVIGKGRH